MSNLLFGFPVYSDIGVTYTPTFSGGSWLAALPLTNLQDRRLHKVARSTNDDAASTQFEVDLKVARSVRVVALPAHNFSTAATVRVRSSNVAGSFGSPVYDSGTIAGWPTGIDAEESEGMNVGFVVVVPAGTTAARYWLIEITDTSNPDTYVELGRLVIAGGWQPTINIAYGAKLGLETETARQTTDGGAAVYTRRPVRRTLIGVINDLPETEALENGFDFQRIHGLDRQFYVIYDPADTTHLHRRAFLGVWKELTSFEQAQLARYGVPISVVEDL